MTKENLRIILCLASFRAALRRSSTFSSFFMMSSMRCDPDSAPMSMLRQPLFSKRSRSSSSMRLIASARMPSVPHAMSSISVMMRLRMSFTRRGSVAKLSSWK